MGWNVTKLRGWMTYLRVRGDLENEAYKLAKLRAQQNGGR